MRCGAVQRSAAQRSAVQCSAAVQYVDNGKRRAAAPSVVSLTLILPPHHVKIIFEGPGERKQLFFTTICFYVSIPLIWFEINY